MKVQSVFRCCWKQVTCKLNKVRKFKGWKHKTVSRIHVLVTTGTKAWTEPNSIPEKPTLCGASIKGANVCCHESAVWTACEIWSSELTYFGQVCRHPDSRWRGPRRHLPPWPDVEKFLNYILFTLCLMDKFSQGEWSRRMLDIVLWSLVQKVRFLQKQIATTFSDGKSCPQVVSQV